MESERQSTSAAPTEALAQDQHHPDEAQATTSAPTFYIAMEDEPSREAQGGCPEEEEDNEGHRQEDDEAEPPLSETLSLLVQDGSGGDSASTQQHPDLPDIHLPLGGQYHQPMNLAMELAQAAAAAVATDNNNACCCKTAYIVANMGAATTSGEDNNNLAPPTTPGSAASGALAVVAAPPQLHNCLQQPHYLASEPSPPYASYPGVASSMLCSTSHHPCLPQLTASSPLLGNGSHPQLCCDAGEGPSPPIHTCMTNSSFSSIGNFYPHPSCSRAHGPQTSGTYDPLLMPPSGDSNLKLPAYDSKSNLSDTASLYMAICRICHQPGDEYDILISPCRCAGTLQFIHSTCLMKWLAISSKKSRKPPKCELCHFQYHRHKKFKFDHWRFPKVSQQDKVLHTIFVVNLVIMISCAIATVMCFLSDKGQISKFPNNKATLSTEEIITLSCGVLFFVSFFIAMSVQIKARRTLYQLFVKFIMQNMEWEIDEYDKSKDSLYTDKFLLKPPKHFV